MKIAVPYLLFILYLFTYPATAQNIDTCRKTGSRLVLEGMYTGSNIYIQNPMRQSDTGFCTEAVFVNGKEIPFEYASAYEIKLNTVGLQQEDSLKVEIFHHNDCRPVILTQHHPRNYDFELVNIEMHSDTLLSWTMQKETDKRLYTIEQFRWNKWIKLGEIEALGDGARNNYRFPIVPCPGPNKIRIKYPKYLKATDRIYNYSQPIEFVSNADPVSYPELSKKQKELKFSTATLYELYDKDGNILKKGFAQTVDCSDILKQIRFICYDNRIDEVSIRK